MGARRSIIRVTAAVPTLPSRSDRRPQLTVQPETQLVCPDLVSSWNTSLIKPRLVPEGFVFFSVQLTKRQTFKCLSASLPLPLRLPRVKGYHASFPYRISNSHLSYRIPHIMKLGENKLKHKRTSINRAPSTPSRTVPCVRGTQPRHVSNTHSRRLRRGDGKTEDTVKPAMCRHVWHLRNI